MFTYKSVENTPFTTDLAENRVLFTSFTPQKASTFAFSQAFGKAI
jgi:hypothetical protein